MPFSDFPKYTITTIAYDPETELFGLSAVQGKYFRAPGFRQDVVVAEIDQSNTYELSGNVAVQVVKKMPGTVEITTAEYLACIEANSGVFAVSFHNIMHMISENGKVDLPRIPSRVCCGTRLSDMDQKVQMLVKSVWTKVAHQC